MFRRLVSSTTRSAMEVPSRPDADTLKNSVAALFHSVDAAKPENYVRGQYDGYRSIAGLQHGLRDLGAESATGAGNEPGFCHLRLFES